MYNFQTVLIADRSAHPERSNATLERVIEVLENVLGADFATHRDNLTRLTANLPLRQAVNAEQAGKISTYLSEQPFHPDQIFAIYQQLSYAEISTAEAIDLHREYKIPVSRLEDDLIPVKGEGSWVMDSKGRWYLDMDSNYSATNMGMNNPEIATGLFNQANLIISMKEDRVQIARSRFLKEIHQMMPSGLTQFYWQNSGGEAVDKSLKIAKAYTGTTQVIAFKEGFHGRTHGAVAVTWNEKYRKPFGLHNLDWVQFAEFNNIDDVKRIMDKTGAKIVILEMVQGEEAGNRPATQKFVDALWELVHSRGGVIIDDEVQAGFGRTALKEGDWFACMSYGVVPDLMAIGKAFGGGYPVTAVVTNKEISAAMKPGFDGSTFGGNPMAMTAALIATRQHRDRNITKNVIERSKQIFEGLEALRRKHPVMKEIQGRGLMFGFSVGSNANVVKLQDELRNEHIKVSLATAEWLRFLPLTIISKGEVAFYLQALDKALSKIN